MFLNREQKKKEYNDLREKNEHIENMLKNIYINTVALRKFEFNNLSNEQKYSTLITLMKYLMPLISNEKAVLKPNNFLEKYNIQYHMPKENTLIINDKFRKFLSIKQRNKKSASSTDNIYRGKNDNNLENLPSISKGANYRKIMKKIPVSSSSVFSGRINQSANQ